MNLLAEETRLQEAIQALHQLQQQHGRDMAALSKKHGNDMKELQVQIDALNEERSALQSDLAARDAAVGIERYILHEIGLICGETYDFLYQLEGDLEDSEAAQNAFVEKRTIYTPKALHRIGDIIRSCKLGGNSRAHAAVTNAGFSAVVARLRAELPKQMAGRQAIIEHIESYRNSVVVKH
jgi:xanthine/CO dehydrogenase XdhC/CoxF family maturation factor